MNGHKGLHNAPSKYAIDKVSELQLARGPCARGDVQIFGFCRLFVMRRDRCAISRGEAMSTKESFEMSYRGAAKDICPAGSAMGK